MRGHQCEVSPSNPSTVTHEQLPSPLPLCHYCCHLGSGENPVHYYLQCLCSDNPCSCQCYCSKEQLIHRKLFYPVDFSDGKPIDPCDRPQALAIAEARCERNYGHRPCESENCCQTSVNSLSLLLCIPFPPTAGFLMVLFHLL